MTIYINVTYFNSCLNFLKFSDSSSLNEFEKKNYDNFSLDNIILYYFFFKCIILTKLKYAKYYILIFFSQSTAVTPSTTKKESTPESSTDTVEENGPVKKPKLLDDDEYPTQILANHKGTPRKYQTLLDRPSSLIQPVSTATPVR